MMKRHVLLFLASLAIAANASTLHVDSIAGFNRLISGKIAKGQLTCDVNGRILFFFPEENGRQTLMLFDDSGHSYVSVPSPLLKDLHCGNLVNLQIQRPGGNGPLPTVTAVRLLSKTDLNDAVPVRTSDINDTRGPPRFIRLTGVVHTVMADDIDENWNWLTLATKDGNAHFATPSRLHALSTLQSLIDAEVSLCGLTGNSSPVRTTDWNPVLLAGESGIDVLRPAPQDPFAVQTHPDGLHRKLVQGTVLGITSTSIFLVTETSPLVSCQLSGSAGALSVGDSVLISGFDRPGISCKTMTGCLVRMIRRREGPFPPARPVTPKTLFTGDNGRRQLQSRLNGKTVRLDGIVRGWRGHEDEYDGFTLECDNILVTVDISGLPDRNRLSIQNGCVAQISGLCTVAFDSAPEESAFPRFRGLTLIPRVPEDIAIVRTPPWWTPARFLLVIVILILFASGILVWNIQLRQLSERRGRELLREQTNRLASDLRVNERTRIAVELHDALSQSLTGVSLQLDAVERFANTDRPKMTQHLGMAMRTLKSCREELRNCLWDLRNRALEEPDMNEAIRLTLAPFVGEAVLQIRFNVPRRDLSDDTAHALMRIIRELASNATRHGRAKTIRIAGTVDDGHLVFSVRDDGLGFDPANHPGVQEGHFGLEGIAERVNRFGGTLNIESSPSNGTSVTISLCI